MAHIIRISDYTSRYQTDIQRYSSQFTRMKKERWHYLQESWKREFAEVIRLEYEDLSESSAIAEVWSKTVNKVRNWTMGLPEQKSEKEREYEVFQQTKQLFRDEIFEKQLLWAGVPDAELLSQDLIIDWKQDLWLKQLGIELPDNCFIFYKPVLYVKKAEIELDTLLITPTEIICLTCLKGEALSVFEVNSDRYWIEYVNQERRKRLSPIPALERMERVIQNILSQHDRMMPIRSIVIAADSIIDHRTVGMKVDFLDKRSFSEWKSKLVHSNIPLKHQQVKACETLLQYCESGESIERNIAEPEMFS
ncbi:nuclease-related domain-containing protein [Alkalihalobacillus sp. FSL W8-0930]